MNKKSDDKEVKIPKEQELTVDNVTKYKAAADITNGIENHVI